MTHARITYPKSFHTEFDFHKPDIKKSNKFNVHTSKHWSRFHEVVKFTSRPARRTLEMASRVVEPLPGANKNKAWVGVASRIANLVSVIFSIPYAIISGLISKPLEFISHSHRPFMSIIDNSDDPAAEKKVKLQLTKEHPLHIRTHNLGFVPNAMSNVGDLRPPKVRAREVANSIVTDTMPPDMIFFQEGFNEGATRILCEGIKKKYPYIVHNIAPQFSGFNSGQMVASKYPIEKVEYDRLEKMITPETMSPRGIVTTTFVTEQGPLKVYAVHTQPLLGSDRAKVREHQMKQIQAKMEKDKLENPEVKQILLGDFNTSRLTAWGEDNKKQTENTVLQRIKKNFNDLYLNDHEKKTGKRTDKKPIFLEHDNQRMGLAPDKLKEPRGTWYVGPFNNKGVIIENKLKIDRMRNKLPKPEVVKANPRKALWGTSKWHDKQPANTARFDMILTLKDSELKGQVEARRVATPKGKQSASTDHLPVDGLIWVTPKAVT